MLPVLENCRICGKTFSYIGGPKVCEACRKELDRIYFEARNVLLNSSKDEQLDAISLAERVGVDPIYIYILAEEGLFEREAPWLGKGKEAEGERERLLKEFTREIESLKKSSAKDVNNDANSSGMFVVSRKKRKGE